MANREQAVRGLLDSGERFSESEIHEEVKNRYPETKLEEITTALRKIMAGGRYDTAGGKYGLKAGY